jgi:signal transduction histidine kinase
LIPEVTPISHLKNTAKQSRLNALGGRLLSTNKRSYLVCISILTLSPLPAVLFPLWPTSVPITVADLIRPLLVAVGMTLVILSILPSKLIRGEVENAYFQSWEYLALTGFTLILIVPFYTLGGLADPTSGFSTIVFLLLANIVEQTKSNTRIKQFHIMKVALLITIPHILLSLMLGLTHILESLLIETREPFGGILFVNLGLDNPLFYIRCSILMTVSVFLTVINTMLQTNQYKLLTSLALEAESARNAESRFLSNMSHEIRNPLNSVMGMLQVLKESKDLSKDDSDSLLLALHSSDHVRHLLDDILDYEKIKSGQYEIELSPFNFGESISQLDRKFKILTRQKGTDFEINGANSVPQYLIGDVVKLEQIANNVIGNAVKFTNTGVVTVDLSYQNGLLSYTITDTGIGMTQGAQESIFSRFSQGDHKLNSTYEGSGLGLSITKEIIDIWGGTISVTSELGVGTSITISLPLVEVEADADIAKYLDDQIKDAEPLNESRINEPLVATQLTALIVDDQAPNLRVLARLFSLLGVQTVAADSGAKALEFISKSNFDFVISDINMPVMTGIELLKRIKLVNADLPVIALSGNVMRDDVEKYLKEGFDIVLGKPIKKEDLEKLITQISS